jgi:hypothetical protein
MPGVPLAEHEGPPPAATLIPPGAPADLLSHDRNRTTITDEPINNAGMQINLLYIVVASMVVLVSLSYYAVFRYFLGARSDDLENP